MPDGELTPAQAKFFTAHINSGLLDRLRRKKDLAFAAALQSYGAAETQARAVLAVLPEYPKGSGAQVEKDALIERYRKVDSVTRANTKSQSATISAYHAGKAALDALTLDAAVLVEKALQDHAMPQAERIAMLIQRVALHLNRIRTAFEAKVNPVLAEIAEKAGATMTLPVVSQFESGQADLQGRLEALTPTGQTADTVLATLDAISADGDRLLMQMQTVLDTDVASGAIAQAIAVGQSDAALRTALFLAARNAPQLSALGMYAEASAMADDAKALAKRGEILFAQTMFDSRPAAATATAARADLQADVERLNVTAQKAIQDKKHAILQLRQELEARFAVVERSFRDIDDVTFAKGQKTPVEGFLALTRSAINGLDGSPFDVLVATKKFVDQAEVIVTAAQNAGATNAAIMAELADMGDAVGRGSRKGNPLAAQFNAMKPEFDDLSRDWPSMLLPEAVQTVQALRVRLQMQTQLSETLDARRKAARVALAAVQFDVTAFYEAYGTLHGHRPTLCVGEFPVDLRRVEAWIEVKTTLSFYDTIDALLVRSRAAIAALYEGLQVIEAKSDGEGFAESLALQRKLEEATHQAIVESESKG